MRPKDVEIAKQLVKAMQEFATSFHPLPGIGKTSRQDCFVEQILESQHRVDYIQRIRSRPASSERANPANELLFDPIRAAIHHQQLGNLDESFWLVFLAIHFGKHPKSGWRYAREVYGKLGAQETWDWSSISADPIGFRAWLATNQDHILRPGIPRGFGNHRKYQSLDAHSKTGTGAAFQSYVSWIGPPRTHDEFFEASIAAAGSDPKDSFDALYESMSAVVSFGRTARFDYLTMIGKLGLANIEPGLAYIRSATGPAAGARLLFFGDRNAKVPIQTLEGLCVDLGGALNVGMQVMEDSLCNWQKSPSVFKAFRG